MGGARLLTMLHHSREEPIAMPNARRLAVALTSLGIVIASTGCGRKQVVEAPEPASDAAAPPPSSSSSSTPAAPASTPDAMRPNAIDGAQRATLEERIHFGFDRADLTPQARTMLSAKVEILRAASGVTLRIEGHADERGSDEYNLALSNRRAGEAKRFLVQQGIDEGRLEVVGYGEEQPAATGHDEQAWSANRRAEFRVTAGVSSR